MCTQITNGLSSCCGSVSSIASSAGQTIGQGFSCMIAAIQKLFSTIIAGVSAGFSGFMGLSMPVQAGVVVGIVAAAAAATYACRYFGSKAKAGDEKVEEGQPKENEPPAEMASSEVGSPVLEVVSSKLAGNDH